MSSEEILQHLRDLFAALPLPAHGAAVPETPEQARERVLRETTQQHAAVAARLKELLNKFGGSTDTGVPIVQRLILSSGANIPAAVKNPVPRPANAVFRTWFDVLKTADR